FRCVATFLELRRQTRLRAFRPGEGEDDEIFGGAAPRFHPLELVSRGACAVIVNQTRIDRSRRAATEERQRRDDQDEECAQEAATRVGDHGPSLIPAPPVSQAWLSGGS